MRSNTTIIREIMELLEFDEVKPLIFVHPDIVPELEIDLTATAPDKIIIKLYREFKMIGRNEMREKFCDLLKLEK